MTLQEGTACCHRSKCLLGTFYVPETHKLRYCTSCSRWYHIPCLQRRGTVAELRASTPTPGSEQDWWIVWKAPANVPRTVATQLEMLVSMPIQRGFRPGPPGSHPVLSIERFTVALRRHVMRRSFQPPTSMPDAENMLNTLLRRCLLDNSEATFREASNAIRWIASMPLTQRVIYTCPRHPGHLL